MGKPRFVRCYRLDSLTHKVDTAYVRAVENGQVLYDVVDSDRVHYPNRIASEEDFSSRWFLPATR